jgi:DNA-binding transcriptional ArsR family regulator
VDPFAALADPVRRDLVTRLAGGPARVVDLAAEHAISRPAISRHLRVLAEAGIVEAEDRGRERHYRLRRDGLAVLTDWLRALEAPQPPIPESAFDGLELEVRRTGRDRRPTTPSPTPSRLQEDIAWTRP